MTDDPNPDPENQQSTGRFAASLLAGRAWTVLSLLLVGAAVAMWFGVKPDLPRPVVLGGIVIAFAAIGGRLVVGPYIASLLPEPDWSYLVDLEVTDPNSGALYRLPPGSLDDWDVTDYSVDNPVSSLYFAKDVDVEQKEMKGTWRGEFSDRELLSAFTRITEQRENLREDAEVGFTLRRMMPVVVRGLVKQEAQKVQQAIEDYSLPDGSTVQEAMDRLVDQSEDLDADDLETVDGGENADPDEQTEPSTDPMTQPEVSADD